MCMMNMLPLRVRDGGQPWRAFLDDSATPGYARRGSHGFCCGSARGSAAKASAYPMALQQRSFPFTLLQLSIPLAHAFGSVPPFRLSIKTNE